MLKQHLIDGRWFDEDTARIWNENTDWDGSNYISAVTGSQWDHQRLYNTATGSWILGEWSQVGTGEEMYTKIDEEAAARWLILCDRKLPKELSEFNDKLEV